MTSTGTPQAATSEVLQTGNDEHEHEAHSEVTATTTVKPLHVLDVETWEELHVLGEHSVEFGSRFSFLVKEYGVR